MEATKARNLLLGAAGMYADDPDLPRAIDLMVNTGDCAWHAASTVKGTRCWCADCCDERRTPSPAQATP